MNYWDIKFAMEVLVRWAHTPGSSSYYPAREISLPHLLAYADEITSEGYMEKIAGINTRWQYGITYGPKQP